MPVHRSASQTAAENQRFFQKVYGWMCLSLIISGITAYWVASSPTVSQFILGNPLVFIGLIITEILLVVGMAGPLQREPSGIVAGAFVIYSFMTGLTLSVIFLIYTITSIGTTFAVTAGMFGVMSLYGYTTKKDLTSWGNVLFMALLGLILASIINLFLYNNVVDWIITYAGVIIFTGLTAYDTQKIRKMNIIGNEGTDEDRKESIMGALRLYLDFVNLFLRLLRLFGKRR